MVLPRVIPILLMSDGDLVKTKQFKKPEYVGDPINVLRIFNEKQVDEIVILDIDATKSGKGPDFDYLEMLTGECFMPLCYGGGVSTIDQLERLFSIGIEKVSLNHNNKVHPEFIKEAASVFGSQSIVASVDIKKNLFGKYRVYDYVTKKLTSLDPIAYCQELGANGVGELMVSFVDRESCFQGYDLPYVKQLVEAIDVPIIINGGAGTYDDFKDAIHLSGVTGVAAGSLFIYYGKHRAVLIRYPNPTELRSLYKNV